MYMYCTYILRATHTAHTLSSLHLREHVFWGECVSNVKNGVNFSSPLSSSNGPEHEVFRGGERTGGGGGEREAC